MRLRSLEKARAARLALAARGCGGAPGDLAMPWAVRLVGQRRALVVGELLSLVVDIACTALCALLLCAPRRLLLMLGHDAARERSAQRALFAAQLRGKEDDERLARSSFACALRKLCIAHFAGALLDLPLLCLGTPLALLDVAMGALGLRALRLGAPLELPLHARLALSSPLLGGLASSVHSCGRAVARLRAWTCAHLSCAHLR